jgi:hypothetical protein
MKHLRRFNESVERVNTSTWRVPQEYKNLAKIIKGTWKSKDDIGEIDEDLVKDAIDSDAKVLRLGKPTAVFCLLYSLEYGRINLAEYILSKYKNNTIKSEDITDILKWIRNSNKMTKELKDESIDLLSRYIGHIY